MTKRRQLQAERLALYLARPDVQARLMARSPGDKERKKELANILARAEAVAKRIEQAGPHPDERYRQLLVDLREDMIQRSQTDGSYLSAREICDDVSAWITQKLGEPIQRTPAEILAEYGTTEAETAEALLPGAKTLEEAITRRLGGEDATVGDAARELVGPDATLEVVDFTLDYKGQLPAGTTHHQGLAHSIAGCDCNQCEELRRSWTKGRSMGLPRYHEAGCDCSPCSRTRLALAHPPPETAVQA